MNPIDLGLSCHHCNAKLVLIPGNAKTVRFRSQPGFGYNVVTCLECRFYVELPPMVSVEQAERFGCQTVWREDYAPHELTEAFEAEHGIHVLTIRPLRPKDEAQVAFFGYLLHQDSECTMQELLAG